MLKDMDFIAGECQPDTLPAALRVTSVIRKNSSDKCVVNEATIFHEKASLRVTWNSSTVDTRIRVGSLVAIRWANRPVSKDGAVCISRLVLLERPFSLNLFDTVPHTWVQDRSLIVEGKHYWDLLPHSYQQLFNAMFWNGDRFYRFLVGPSSLRGHHNGKNGNFTHSLEVAQSALTLAKQFPAAHKPILILCSLIHDAGKADEYRFNQAHRRFEISERGALIGHRQTVLEWLAVARNSCRSGIQEQQYLSILHALTAIKGAPAWMGLREPRSLESTILSTADRVSGQGDLVTRMKPTSSGFGNYHAHLGNRPYVIAQSTFQASTRA